MELTTETTVHTLEHRSVCGGLVQHSTGTTLVRGNGRSVAGWDWTQDGSGCSVFLALGQGRTVKFTEATLGAATLRARRLVAEANGGATFTA